MKSCCDILCRKTCLQLHACFWQRWNCSLLELFIPLQFCCSLRLSYHNSLQNMRINSLRRVNLKTVLNHEWRHSEFGARIEQVSSLNLITSYWPIAFSYGVGYLWMYVSVTSYLKWFNTEQWPLHFFNVKASGCTPYSIPTKRNVSVG